MKKDNFLICKGLLNSYFEAVYPCGISSSSQEKKQNIIFFIVHYRYEWPFEMIYWIKGKIPLFQDVSELPGISEMSD